MKKCVIMTGIVAIILSNISYAADNKHIANNPANIMNTLDQFLPGIQPPNQGQLQATNTPQYIKHAEEVTTQVIVHKVQLLGAKTIPSNVQAVCNSMIGKKIDFKGIQQLANSVESAYRSAGFILVQVVLPPQEINAKAGVVQLQVINGAIKNITFVGDNPKGAQAQLHRYAEQIEVEDPISYHSIDRFLILANQVPGIDVSATLVPDPKITGAADLLVKVVQTPVSGFMNINNRGTDEVGPYQMSVGGSVYDLFGADALTAVGATSLNGFDQLKYGNLSYDLITGQYATEINPSISKTETKPAGDLSSLDMVGNSTKYNFGVNQPLYTSTLQNLNLQTALYHVDSENDVFTNSLLYQDRITGLTLGLNYQGVFWQSYHDMTLSVTQGMPIMGAPHTLTDPSVANAKTTFTRFNLTTADIHYFTQRTSMALDTQMQYTNNILVSSEQIGFGGQQFGQAFAPYVISGNSGIMGSLAARYDLPVFAGLKLLQPEIFYDAGAVHAASTAGNSGRASAQSAGAGVNLQWRKNVNMNLTLAKPLKITNSSGVDMGWAGFINFTVSA